MQIVEPDDSLTRPAWRCGGSLFLVVLVLGLNLGVFTWAPDAARRWLTVLEYDGRAIQQGQLWRLVTCNLVHYDLNHFLLDATAFAVLGWLYEPYFRRAFPWLLLVMGAAVGMSSLIFLDENTRLRGLSGVDSGLFAAALWIEFHLARRDPARWLWVAPAAALFAAKTGYETATGESFFGTHPLLGPIQLATTAHLAGIIAALFFCAGLPITAPPAADKTTSPAK